MLRLREAIRGANRFTLLRVTRGKIKSPEVVLGSFLSAGSSL